MEEPVISWGEKKRQTEVYLVLDIALLGVGKQQEVQSLGPQAPLSRMEQHREAAGGRPLRMLKVQGGF